jgi:hypothetical protein
MTLPDGSFAVIWRGTSGIADINEAIKFMQDFPGTNRLELWSKAHAASPKGFAPMMRREAGSRQLQISSTLKMLMSLPIIPAISQTV